MFTPIRTDRSGIDSNILKPSFHNEYEALSSFN